MTPVEKQRVKLRAEQRGANSHFLDAYLQADGDLVLEGQDPGPITAVVPPDGEYEYWYRIKATDLGALREVLGMPENADLLQGLVERWSGSESFNLETTIRESNVPHEFSCYS